VLERDKAQWGAEPERSITAEEFAEDVRGEIAARLADVLKLSPDVAAAILASTGAAGAVRLWAASRGARLLAKARRDQKSGMDALQRQGKWTNLLHAASWLAYAGLFLAHLLWPSVGLILLASLLAGPANVVWQSLTTRVVSKNFPKDKGKVYSAVTFYTLLCSVVGTLGLGWLMAALPTTTALLVIVGILVACAVLDTIQTFVIFPLGRGGRAPKGPAPTAKVPDASGTTVARTVGPTTATAPAAASYNGSVKIARSAGAKS
jgi:hypothetical protein